MFIRVDQILKEAALRMGADGNSALELLESFLPTVYNEINIRTTRSTITEKYKLGKDVKTFALPINVMLLCSVGYEDENGRIIPMGVNDKIPRPLLFSNTTNDDLKCGCKKECAISNYISDDTITETIYLQGDGEEIEATLTTRTIAKGNGQIVKIVTTPYLNDSNDLAYETTEKEICKLPTKECGCVEDADTAKNIMVDSCGQYSVPCCHKDEIKPSKYGYRLIEDGTKLLFSINYNVGNVVITYFPLLQSQNDYKIPYIAREAILMGLKWHYLRNDIKYKGLANDYERDYKIERNKLESRTDKILYSDMDKILGF